MNNGFSNIDFYELWLKYQLIIKKYALIGGISFLVLILLINIFNNPYKNIENNLINNAKKYIKDNNVDVTDNFYLSMITLDENGYYTDYSSNIECNQASGVYIQKESNNIQYTPYLMCDKYKSAIITKTSQQTSNYLTLKGDNPMIINDDEPFNDPGYINNSNYTIEVNSKVEESPNLYFVDYIVKDNNEIKEIVERIVISKQASEDDSEDTAYNKGLKLKLKGSQVITLEKGSNYQELGAIATDRHDGDITNKIKIFGSVNTDNIGEITLTYKVTNSSGTTVSVDRIVKVVKPIIKMNVTSGISTSNYTNTDITITLNVNSPYYKKTILPNNLTTYSSKITYRVITNGTYRFKVYNEYGDYQEEAVTVNNINKNPPLGTCTLTNTNGTSLVKVTSSSSIDILGYSYSDGSSYTSYINNSQYTFNKNINIAYVRIKDKAGNVKNINCSSESSVITAGTVEYHFINSGRVDAILIRTGDHAAFVDGGWGYDGPKAVSYLKAIGIKKLDFIIGSHSHLNHVGALGDVIDNFDVGAIYFTEDPLNCKNCNDPNYGAMAYKYVNAAMKRKGMTAIVQRKGDIINLGSVKFECIAPINYSASSANRNSLNHIVTFGSTTLLLTGDYMDSDALLNTYPLNKLNIDILKYPHHGNYTIKEELLNALSPAYVIAQNDENEFGGSAATSKRLMEKAGVKLYQNYLDGNIVVISDGKNIEVKTNIDPKTFK